MKKLADYFVEGRCGNCKQNLPTNSRVTEYAVRGVWILVECPKCGTFTPFRIESEAA